ncbi:hypothetical protein Dxin01_03965 [Deinococcus xinjiangensis]|uniref:Uncharacterized protein n=1 Tax=Deinococcus xinjiangensis TaxID=457454 RepID=A0ABP9VG62_9DEIO
MDSRDPTLTRQAFETRDAVRGDDGELYHLPTLRALHRLGRLSQDSPAFAVLMQALSSELPRFARLTA